MRVFHPALLLACLLGSAASDAQLLKLRHSKTQATRVAVQIGEIDVYSRLDSLETSGLAFYVSFPEGPFEIVDTRQYIVGVQPFAPGTLFREGAVMNNSLVRNSDVLGPERQWLEYAVVLGPSPRAEKNNGVVASFALRCVKAADWTDIQIDDMPIRETRLVLPDGVSERQFTKIEGLEIRVADEEIGSGRALTAAPERTWGQVKSGEKD